MTFRHTLRTTRIWRRSGREMACSDYVEVKKTTHLHGMNGAYKLLTYWMQAALTKAGAVQVAFAPDARVTHTERFGMERLEEEIKERKGPRRA